MSAPIAPPPSPTIVSDHERYLHTRYFPALDGLRCLSILWVIGFHCHLGNTILFRRGDWGVGLFFAISGFLITTLLLREQRGTGTISLKNFYARRTLRIFPLYYAAICLYTLLVLKVEHGPERGAFFRHLPFFLIYTGNWFVDRFAADHVIFAFSWTLATEEQFYLLWPGVLRIARRRSVALAIIMTVLVIGIGFDVLAATGRLHLGDTGNRIATSIATPICLGCILAMAMDDRRWSARLRPMLGTPASAPLLLVLVVGLYAAMIHVAALSTAEFWLDAAMVPAVVLLVGAVCWRRPGVLMPLLANPVVRYVGTVSYGMYLLHMLAINACRKFFAAPGWTFFAASVGLSLVLASLSFWLYERQFLKLKSRFASRAPDEPAKPEFEPATATRLSVSGAA